MNNVKSLEALSKTNVNLRSKSYIIILIVRWSVLPHHRQYRFRDAGVSSAVAALLSCFVAVQQLVTLIEEHELCKKIL